jgi:phosphohistidine phosphatase
MPTPHARVYLVRHAKAEPQGVGDDASRPLTPEGRARFEEAALRLAKKLALRRVGTSPLVRARETADILAAATGVAVVEEPALASGTVSGKALLVLVRGAGDGTALVGHNPELAEAIALAAGRAVEVKPGAIAALDVDADLGTVTLAWIEAP